jgi:hypothetical protein
LLGAVESGGGVVDEPGETEALVWLGSDNQSSPSSSTRAYAGAVDLRRGGAWTERGLINAECIFTSAAGVYSGTAAEHALALMLAGARRLDGATSSAYRPS